MTFTKRGRPLSGPILATALLLIALASCSLIVNKADQCSSEADCNQEFGGYPACQDGVCVYTGLGPPGCFYGEAGAPAQLATQCTAASCIPFDDCARLGICDGGALPPLVPPDAQVTDAGSAGDGAGPSDASSTNGEGGGGDSPVGSDAMSATDAWSPSDASGAGDGGGPEDAG